MDKENEDQQEIEIQSGIRKCFAETCRFNRSGACDFRCIEIGIDGKCTAYEERTEDMVRKYLAARGLSEEAINHILSTGQVE